MELPLRILNWQDRYCSPCPQLSGTLVGEEKENPVTPEMCRCREEYNEKVREYANVATDIKACEILETNLSDNERYQLSSLQLTLFRL